jgi:hypothetical protein
MSHKFLNINWDLFDKQSAQSKELLNKITNTNTNNNTTNTNTTNTNTNKTITYDRPLTYFLPPPVINTTFSYQDINHDYRLREDVTNFFLRKTIKWINTYTEFKNNKYLLPKLKTDEGYELIYNILRQYRRKTDCNWYDLRNNYELVKDYIRYRLNKK